MNHEVDISYFTSPRITCRSRRPPHRNRKWRDCSYKDDSPLTLYDIGNSTQKKMSAPVHSEDGVRRPLLADQRNADETAESSSRTFKRNLGASEAFAIVISIVIGSGIFTSPGAIDSNVPSPGVALIIWLVGGILAWTGATTMAELGTAIPGEGMSIFPYQWIFRG